MSFPTNPLSAALLLIGAFWILIAALGMVRLPDVLCRLHASTKASSLGLGLMLLAAATHFLDSTTSIKVGGAILFIFLTNPIGAHLLARSTVTHMKHTHSCTVNDYGEDA